MKGLLLASRKAPVNWGSDQQPGHGWQHRWGWQIWHFPHSVLIWQHWGWLCCWGRGRGGRRICPNVWQNCSSLWNKNLKHVPKHRILPTAPTTFSCSLSGSCALPEPHFPDALGTQTGSYRPSTPPQYSWNSFPRWRQRKKTIRGKKLWSYHQKWPQKKKNGAWNFLHRWRAVSESITSPIYDGDFFCKALLEGSLSALLRNLANTRADQSHSFTQLDFLQLKCFSLLLLAHPKMSAEFPLALPTG